ncbi:MAG TPA: transposase, partial [Candidatus Sulfopaludibacter sp.]|nr:transposase [Candidatus Sulfopaludibacter sp.]
MDDDDDENIVIAVDSTGIKVTNRGQSIRDKWGIRKGYLKIHIAVDIKGKKILLMKLTIDEHIHDIKKLLELVQNIIKSNSVTASKLF